MKRNQILPLLAMFIIAFGDAGFPASKAAPSYPACHPFKSAEAQQQYMEFNTTLSEKWPVSGETMLIETPSGTTFVRISGSETGKPLVLLAGGGANSLMWLSNIKELSEHFRVYTVDNIYDYGLSIYKRPFNNAEDFCVWLDELLDALELDSMVNMMGMSYGGWITCEYALHRPERLDKIVLLAPAATVYPVSTGFIFRVLIQPLHSSFAKSFYPWVFRDLYNKDAAGRQRVLDVAEESGLSDRCFTPKKFVVPQVLKSDKLRSLKVPTLFLVGEHDKVYPAKNAVARVNRCAPQIKTAIIMDAGHDLIISQTARVHAAVLQFLEP